MPLSSPYGQHQNGLSEKTIDLLTRRMRAGLAHSGLTTSFWSSTLIMTADTMNVTPHKALRYDTPYHAHYGYHADMRQFKPLGCRCTVFRPKEILTSKKLTNRGISCVFVGIGTSFGRKCYLAYSKEHNKVYASSNVEFDETFFPMRTKGRRDYGIFDEQEPHGHEISTEAQAIDNVTHIINHLPVENPTWDPKDIYVTPFDRQYQCAIDEQITKLYDQNGHTQTHTTTSSTPSPSAGTKAKILEDNENDNDGEGVPINDEDIVLANDWEKYGDILLDKVSDKQLVEYIIGKDIHMYVPEAYHPKYKVNWKFMLTGYELSRRNDTIASMKVIGSYPAYDGKGDGLDRNSINVSQGKINLRQIIRDNYPSMQRLKDMDQRSNIESTMTGRAVCALINNPITNAMTQLTRGCERKIMQASKAFGAGRLTRKEGHDTAFAACVGTELTETLCDEMEIQMALVSPAPLHYADARKRPDAEKWKSAEKVEIKNCFDNGTFQVCEAKEVPHGTKVMNCVFSYKVKTDSEGNETQCKARLNCDGRYQSESTYSETFAPTSRFTNIRAMCALAAQEDLRLYQFDVKSAFLIPECKEEIYIRLPGQYSLPDGKVLRLRKMLYGLKNSAFAWNEHFTKWMKDHGFTNVDGDGVTFVKIENQRNGSSNKLIVGMHVDDGIVCASSKEIYEKFIVELQRDFVLSSHGKLEWYLGCKIIQDMEKGTVTINQEKYANDVLRRFNMQEAKPVSTPCEAGLHLSGDDCPNKDKRDPEVIRDYQACVGSLMYLSVLTRGDCSFAINQTARFLNNPGPTHVAAVKRILRYIAGTANLGLTYRKSADEQKANKLNASADADHAGADDRRSVSGWCVMLNGAMISWASKRQPVTAISSTESEFYSVSQCAVECVYLRRLMEQIGYMQKSPTLIAQDNMACIYLTQGARMYHKAKHIDTRVYKVRELSSGDNPEVKLWKIDGSDQPSDIFTKALPRASFERHRSKIMGTSI